MKSHTFNTSSNLKYKDSKKGNNNNVIKFPNKKPKVAITDKYEKIYESYQYISRANGQRLNAQDEKILNFLIQMTEKNGYAIIDYSFLEKKLRKSKDTVKRTLNHLSHIFTRKFHPSLLINGHEEFFKLVIERTPESQEILLKSKEKHSLENNIIKRKNTYHGTKKCTPPLHIYREKITEEEKEEEEAKAKAKASSSSSFSPVTLDARAREEISPKKSKMSEEKAFEPCEEAQAFSDIKPVTIHEKPKEIPKPMLEDSSTVDLSTAKAERDYYKARASRSEPLPPGDPLVIQDFIPILGKVDGIISSLKIEENMSPDQLSGNSGILETDDDDSPELSPIEQKLETIENSHDVSKTMQLQRKLVGIFPSSVAMKIIDDYDFKLIEPNKLQVIQKTDYQLSTQQKTLIRNEIKAVYGTDIQITLVVFQPEVETPSDNPPETLITPMNYNELPKSENWMKLREWLVENIGEAMVISWFDRLERTEDLENKTLIFKGSRWITEHIKTHYCQQIISSLENEEIFKRIKIKTFEDEIIWDSEDGNYTNQNHWYSKVEPINSNYMRR